MMIDFRQWWKRLWQPGEPLPEYIFGTVCSSVLPISCVNVSSISWFAIGPSGKSLPIYTADGCRLEQHIHAGHLHAVPVELSTFVEVFPRGLVANPEYSASINCGGRTSVDQAWLEETGVDEAEQ